MAWLQQLAQRRNYVQYIRDTMSNLQYYSDASEYTSVPRSWHIQKAVSVRLGIVLRGPKEFGKPLLRDARELAVGSPEFQRTKASVRWRHLPEEVHGAD